jgi:hypothetical protein
MYKIPLVQRIMQRFLLTILCCGTAISIALAQTDALLERLNPLSNTTGSDGLSAYFTAVPAVAGNIICSPRLYGRIVTEDMRPVEGVRITLTPACTPNPTCTIAQAESDTSGQYSQCNFTQCSPCKTYLHTPKLDEDPKNGVSTYDLLLINRHILGLAPLGSPYKMIAADANLSYTITGFDIVQLRKLILGITSDFTDSDQQDSWRFIPQDYVFPNPLNPFEASQNTAEASSIDKMPYPTTWKGDTTVSAYFIGIKIGDVNLSAQSNQRSEALDSAPFGFEHTANQQSGTLLSIPIRYNGRDTLQACQMGIHFDPRRLKYRGVQAHDIDGVTQANFGTTEAAAGSLRFVWLAPDLDRYRSVTHGAVVFDLLFEVIEDLNKSTDQPLIALDDQVLDNSAWNLQDKEYHLVSTESTPSAERTSASSAFVAVQCNPDSTSGVVTLSITPKQSTKVRIALFDQQGKMLQWKTCPMEKGVVQTIEFTGLLTQPAGIYTWKVFNADFTEQGHILKR